MDGCIRDLAIAWRSRDWDQNQWIILHEKNLPIYRFDVTNFTKMVEDYQTRHTICHEKFAAADALKKWFKKNPSGLRSFCDLTRSDLLDALIP